MLALSPRVRVFAAREAVDFRRGFDALHALVRDGFGDDPLSGHLFVFFNRARDRLKILTWDRNGFWLLYKRLERGTFERVVSPDRAVARVELTRAQLLMLLDGIALDSARTKKHFVADLRPTARDGEHESQVEHAAGTSG
ncbi:MAG: IS66 family insertion sequence element accessory protein TnpB [Candidatus Binatia bacterium]